MQVLHKNIEDEYLNDEEANVELFKALRLDALELLLDAE